MVSGNGSGKWTAGAGSSTEEMYLETSDNICKMEHFSSKGFASSGAFLWAAGIKVTFFRVGWFDISIIWGNHIHGRQGNPPDLSSRNSYSRTSSILFFSFRFPSMSPDSGLTKFLCILSSATVLCCAYTLHSLISHLLKKNHAILMFLLLSTLLFLLQFQSMSMPIQNFLKTALLPTFSLERNFVEKERNRWEIHMPFLLFIHLCTVHIIPNFKYKLNYLIKICQLPFDQFSASP